MKIRRWGYLAMALAASGSTACSLGHEKPFEPTSPEKVGTLNDGFGLAPGAVAPDATVLDGEGRSISLSSARAGRPVVLFFYKGGWCPSCNYQIHEFTKHYDEFRKRGVSVLAISVDKPGFEEQTKQEYAVPFPLLSDPDLAAHKAYHVADHYNGVMTFMLGRMGVDLEERSGRTHHDAAVPSIFLTDAEGKIRWSHADPDYGTRPAIPDVLAAIDRSGIAGPIRAEPVQQAAAR